MKVLLFEQFDGGHYSNYLDCLIPAISGLCDNLVIAANRSMLESTRCWASLPNIDFFSLPNVSPSLTFADRAAASNNLLHALKSLRPDFSILPSADAQATMLAIPNTLLFNRLRPFGHVEGTLHYGYGYSAVSLKQQLKEAIYSQTIRRAPFSSVNFVNFQYYEYALAKHIIPPERARLVGDPVPQPDRIGRMAARDLFGLEQNGRYLGLLGSLDHRKAIPEILAAFRRANLGRNDRLLLAGNLAPHFSKLIESEYRDLTRQGRLIVIDRYLTDYELAHGYEALDLATIAYNDFPGLASLALKAIAAGTPIIANNFGWLSAISHRFPVGASVDVKRIDEFALVMSSQLEASSRGYNQTESIRRLLSFHSVKNFVSLMTRGLRSARGERKDETLDWKWVLEGN